MYVYIEYIFSMEPFRHALFDEVNRWRCRQSLTFSPSVIYIFFGRLLSSTLSLSLCVCCVVVSLSCVCPSDVVARGGCVCSLTEQIDAAMDRSAPVTPADEAAAAGVAAAAAASAGAFGAGGEERRLHMDQLTAINTSSIKRMLNQGNDTPYCRRCAVRVVCCCCCRPIIYI